MPRTDAPHAMPENPYLRQAHAVLPRLLALFDTNPISVTRGFGDRYRWAWKLVDFSNGTFQGAAHGLACLLHHRLLPDWFAESSALRRIEAMFTGARVLTRKNGSLEEACPFESSFCVTALVAYDLLSAVEALQSHLAPQQRAMWLETVEPMIGFLHRADERHGIISNHLASAAAALFKWAKLSGGAGRERGGVILARLRQAQQAEGWFQEYQGADPGYQSLCTHFLADLHRIAPELQLCEPLSRSMRFLWHFAHPDGSFGGCYGSRNTRFYFPSGVQALAAEIPEAAALARFMRASIERQSTVTLSVMDDHNLVPMFNSYCCAAVLDAERPDRIPQPTTEVPCCDSATWRREFASAGLVIDRSASHYTIVSSHKGGVCYRYPIDGTRAFIDTGAVARTRRAELFTTQAYRIDNKMQIEANRITIIAPLTAVKQRLPTPLQFWFLRLLNLTVMRNSIVASWVKRQLARLLITRRGRAVGLNRRTIDLGVQFTISDEWEKPAGSLERVAVTQPFSVIHMASQGYWQRQDEQ
jgi:hypothetical protein